MDGLLGKPTYRSGTEKVSPQKKRHQNTPLKLRGWPLQPEGLTSCAHEGTDMSHFWWQKVGKLCPEMISDPFWINNEDMIVGNLRKHWAFGKKFSTDNFLVVHKWASSWHCILVTDGGFHKWGLPPNGWFIRENPIKMDDLGVPTFWETTICFILVPFKMSMNDHLQVPCLVSS